MTMSTLVATAMPTSIITSSSTSNGGGGATKFRVVEFYRNNRALSKQLTTTTTANNEVKLVNGGGGGDRDGVAASLYSLLGFEIVGGYLADIPATIVNVATDTKVNWFPQKVQGFQKTNTVMPHIAAY